MDPKWTSGNELNYLKEVLNNTDEVRKNPFTDRLEKAFIKKQIFNGQPVQSKTFKIANSESKYLAVKNLIESMKSNRIQKIKIDKTLYNSEKNKTAEDVRHIAEPQRVKGK